MDIRAQGGAGEPGRLLDEGAEIEVAQGAAGAAGVSEHLLAQIGGVQGGRLDGGEVVVHRRCRRQVETQQAGLPEYGGEQIVEIVGDAAGEHA